MSDLNRKWMKVASQYRVVVLGSSEVYWITLIPFLECRTICFRNWRHILKGVSETCKTNQMKRHILIYHYSYNEIHLLNYNCFIEFVLPVWIVPVSEIRIGQDIRQIKIFLFFAIIIKIKLRANTSLPRRYKALSTVRGIPVIHICRQCS